MSKKVFIPVDIAEVGKIFLLDKGYQVVVGTAEDEKTLLLDGKEADAVLLRTTKINEKMLKEWRNVKIIARHGVGYDNIDVEAAERLGIWVTNTPNSNASTVAETTLSLILALSKNIVPVSNKMNKGDFFYKTNHKGMDLEGKILGIIGYGRIGQMVAKKAKAFDMEVLVFSPSLYKKQVREDIIIAETKEEVFKRADIVSLHLPANETTKSSIGYEQFQWMKKDSFFINTARAEIVKEDDLLQILKEKKIRGAALDVFLEEPPPSTHPYFALENVLLTPHIASNTEECMDRMALHAAMEIDRVLSGKSPQWPVNKILPSYRE